MPFPTATIVFFASMAGLFLILLRRLPEATRMTPEEIAYVMQTRESLPMAILGGGGRVVGRVWRTYLRAAILMLAMKAMSRIRIVMLKIEQYLFKLTAKIRARSAITPRPSQYWQEIYGWRKNITWRGRGGKKMKVYIPVAERKVIAKELHTDVESLKLDEHEDQAKK